MLLEPGRYVDAVAVNVVLGLDDVPKMDGNPQRDWGNVARFIGILGERDFALDLLRSNHRIKRTREFRQDAIASRFDYSAAGLGCLRPHDPGHYLHPAIVRACFILGHQDGVADDVRECDGAQSATGAALPYCRTLLAALIDNHPRVPSIAERSYARAQVRLSLEHHKRLLQVPSGEKAAYERRIG